MRKYKNGEYLDMSPKEIKAMEDAQAQIPPPDPMQERMEKQERKLDSIEGLCNSILSLLRGGR